MKETNAIVPTLASQQLKEENQDHITTSETNNPPPPNNEESQMPQGKPAEISHNQATQTPKKEQS